MAFMGLLITSDKMLILCSFDLGAEDTALYLKLSFKSISVLMKFRFFVSNKMSLLNLRTRSYIRLLH